MDENLKSRYEARALIIKAMAHPTRLYLVDVLSQGEKCVHELTEMVGADMSTVSRHLGVLKSAGIVQTEKRGQQVYQSLRMSCVLSFFDCVESVIRLTAEENLKLAEQKPGDIDGNGMIR